MTAKLVKTEAVVEGRTEVRWTVVEDDDTPEIDDGSATHPIGDPTPRITARARTTGTARFTVDVALPGLLEAAVLRSPHANAKVTSLDLDAARAVPGVRCVLGPGDGPDNGDSPLSDAPDFAGGAIAAVAADSADAADAALEALAPQFEVLGFVSGIDEAFERQDFLIDPTEHVRGDADGRAGGRRGHGRSRVPRARPAPQLDGAARRRRRLARGRAHRSGARPRPSTTRGRPSPRRSGSTPSGSA